MKIPQDNDTPTVGKPKRKRHKAPKIREKNILDPIIRARQENLSEYRRSYIKNRNRDIYYQCPYCNCYYHIRDDGGSGIQEKIVYPKREILDKEDRPCRRCKEEIANMDWHNEQKRQFKETHHPCGLGKVDIYDSKKNLIQPMWTNSDGSPVTRCLAMPHQCYSSQECPIHYQNLDKELK